jgi:hypothetical protein
MLISYGKVEPGIEANSGGTHTVEESLFHRY